MALFLELLLFSLSWLISVASISAVYNRTETLPGCQSKCGNLDVPYPYGIGVNCSIAGWARINCNTSFNLPKPTLGKGPFEVVHLSLTELRVKLPVATECYDQNGESSKDIGQGIKLWSTPYTFSTKNKFIGIGCDTFLKVFIGEGDNDYAVCSTVCDEKDIVIDGSCSGIGCCQISLPKGLKEFYASAGSIDGYTNVRSFETCGFGFMVEQDKYTFKKSDFINTTSYPDLPIVVNFAVSNQTCEAAKQNATSYACKENSYCYESTDRSGYLCSCNKGYEGNPYLQRSCQDVDECEDPNNNPCKGICNNTVGGYECSCPRDSYGDGTKNGTGCTKNNNKIPVLKITLGIGLGFLCLLAGGSYLYASVKKRKFFKMKEVFFQKNGGLLLKQQISSHEGGVESMIIFASEELILATNNYDKDRILGQGGSGTVYKGILPDLRVVAVKRSKIIDQSQLGQFINEIIILTQINHRNVVKLMGCCLETEVPLLVYEYVPNGTLFSHLHRKRGGLPFLSWEERLRIASETASALTYLHSAASTPIIHRDVKSANILLDNNFMAKIADFGASRLNPLDETQISTLVQGTMGYLDPGYFQSGQLTEKSDVYSFGVVLAELLTGEKPVCFQKSQKQRHLATYFISLVKEDCLFENFDAGNINEENVKQIHAVSQLANRCLCVKGEERPSMKEVAMELERVGGYKKHQWISNVNQEDERSPEHVDLYAIPSSAFYSTNSTSGQHNSETETMQPVKVSR